MIPGFPNAGPSTIVGVWPEKVSLPPGAEFKISVNATDIVDLFAFDVTLRYDGALLHGINVTFGPLFSPDNTIPIVRNISDSGGKVQAAVTLRGDVTQTGVTGNILLFQAFFRVNGLGSAQFDIVDGDLFVVDSSAQAIIPSEVRDGVFDNTPPDVAVVSVTAAPSVVLQGQSVAIMIVVENHGSISESFSVRVYYDDTEIGSQAVADLPPGASHDVLFSWTTSLVPEGTYQIRAVADTVPGETNTGDNSAVGEAVTVRSENIAPTLAEISDQTVEQGSLLSFKVNATDQDGDALTFGLTESPSGTFPEGARISSTTGIFSWTPSPSQGPGTYSVRVVVSDGLATSYRDIKITATENTPPTLPEISDRVVEQGGLLTFNVDATDQDGDALAFSLTQAPSGAFPEGASIDATTGVFSWTPSASQGPGTYSVRVVVSDGLATSYRDVSITVTEPSRTAPVPWTNWLPWVGLGLVVVLAVLVVVIRARRKNG